MIFEKNILKTYVTTMLGVTLLFNQATKAMGANNDVNKDNETKKLEMLIDENKKEINAHEFFSCLEEKDSLNITMGDYLFSSRKKQDVVMKTYELLKEEARTYIMEENDLANEKISKMRCVLREGNGYLSKRNERKIYRDYLEFTGEIVEPILQKPRKEITAQEWANLFELRTTGIEKIDDLEMSRAFALNYLQKFENIKFGNENVAKAIEQGLDKLVKVYELGFDKQHAINDFIYGINILQNQFYRGEKNNVSVWKRKLENELDLHVSYGLEISKK